MLKYTTAAQTGKKIAGYISFFLKNDWRISIHDLHDALETLMHQEYDLNLNLNLMLLHCDRTFDSCFTKYGITF